MSQISDCLNSQLVSREIIVAFNNQLIPHINLDWFGAEFVALDCLPFVSINTGGAFVSAVDCLGVAHDGAISE
jgi:hypothetical protein